MPAVLCGLTCFDAPVPCTAASAARALSSSLDMGLGGEDAAMEVYRLEPLEPDAPLEPEDVVLCRLPSSLDLAALEDLHCELEDLRVEHKELQLQYSRTKEALMALSAGAEASTAPEGAGDIAPQEVHQLRMQLAESERNQQETKATVIALRGEFMRLVEVWSDAGGSKRGGDLAFPAYDADAEAARHGGASAPGGPRRHSLHVAAEAPRAPAPRTPKTPGGRPGSSAGTPAARAGGAASPVLRVRPGQEATPASAATVRVRGAGAGCTGARGARTPGSGVAGGRRSVGPVGAAPRNR